MTECALCGKPRRPKADWKNCPNCGGHIKSAGDPCCQGCSPCERCDKYVKRGELCEGCYKCPDCCACETDALTGGPKGCDRDKDFINV